MADGRHLEFRFLAIISASINIFALNLVQWWKIGIPRGPNDQKSDFRKYKMADGRHLGFRFCAIISVLVNIFVPSFVPRWKIGSPKGPSAEKSHFRKSKMADGRHLGFQFSAINSASRVDQHFRTKFVTEMKYYIYIYTVSQKKPSRFVFVRTSSNFHRFW